MRVLCLIALLTACDDGFGPHAPRPRAIPAALESRTGSEDPEATSESAGPETCGEPAHAGERGSCALFLTLADDESGAPVPLPVQLWRINIPENADWTAGDQLQVNVAVPEEGLRVEDLPPGRYRIYSGALRFGGEAPPAFRVSGSLTRADLAVPTCKQRKVLLRVYDESGRLLRRAIQEDGGVTSGTRIAGLFPPWRNERHLKLSSLHRTTGGVRACGGSRSEPRAVAAGPDGAFDVGPARDDSRDSAFVTYHEFRFEGRSTVYLRLTREAGRDRAYAAVALTSAFVRGSVFLPDGGLVADASRLGISCSAVPAEQETLPVTIRVRGFKTVVVSYRPGDRFPDCRLEPEDPTSEDGS